MTTPAPDKEIGDFLAELDQEFGKKSKSQDANAEARARNRAWHEKHPAGTKGAPSYARAQLERAAYRNYYDWDQHRVMLLEEAQRGNDQTLPDLEWFPIAKVTYVIRQRCSCCATTVEFIGSEYVQFRGRRRTFHELGGGSHQMTPMVLQRADKVDANLLAFGLPSGDPLPDLVEELEETVRRCPGCIAVERTALDLWVRATQPSPQGDLLDPATPTPTPPSKPSVTGAKLEAILHREFGTSEHRVKSVERELDLGENNG